MNCKLCGREYKFRSSGNGNRFQRIRENTCENCGGNIKLNEELDNE